VLVPTDAGGEWIERHRWDQLLAELGVTVLERLG
jgi:hypothetical protein